MYSRNYPYTTSRLVGLAFPPILICIHGLLGDRHHKVRDEIFLSVRAIKDCVPGRDLGLCSWLHYFVFCREDSMAKRQWNDVCHKGLKMLLIQARDCATRCSFECDVAVFFLHTPTESLPDCFFVHLQKPPLQNAVPHPPTNHRDPEPL